MSYGVTLLISYDKLLVRTWWNYTDCDVIIGASRSKPHTSELAGGMSVIMYVCMYEALYRAYAKSTGHFFFPPFLFGCVLDRQTRGHQFESI